jgi:hypothetical protein
MPPVIRPETLTEAAAARIRGAALARQYPPGSCLLEMMQLARELAVVSSELA